MICLAITMIIVYGMAMRIQVKRFRYKQIKLNWVMKLAKGIMENCYIKPLRYVWTNYVSRLYKVKEFTMEMASQLKTAIDNDLDVKFILLKFYYIPRLIFVAVMFCEIVIFQRFNLTYKLFILILLSIIFQSYLTVIYDETLQILKNLEDKYLTVK
jgi:hypothetical protein